jgi:hypothetical protein
MAVKGYGEVFLNIRVRPSPVSMVRGDLRQRQRADDNDW